MQEITFYKDRNHNYLILKDEKTKEIKIDDTKKDKIQQEGIEKEKIKKEQNYYQERMITDNKISYLLECKIRYVDGERFFYYEISSKQSIRTMYLKKKIQYDRLCHLFEQIRDVFLELEKYLLDSRCLILDPDYIYGNPETGEFYFLYYPQSITELEESFVSPSFVSQSAVSPSSVFQSPVSKNLESKDSVSKDPVSKGPAFQSLTALAEFLIERIDHEEEEAVAASYHIYEQIMDDKFILSDIMRIFDGNRIKTKEKKEARSIDERIQSDFSYETKEMGKQESGKKEIGRKEIGRKETGSKETGSKETEIKGSEEQKEIEKRREIEIQRDREREEYKMNAEYPDFFSLDQDTLYETDQEEQDSKRHIWLTGIMALLCMAGAAGICVLGSYDSFYGREKILAMAGAGFLAAISVLLFLYFLVQMVKYRKKRSRNQEEEKEDVRMMQEPVRSASKEEFYFENPYIPRHIQQPQESYGNTIFMEAAVQRKENKLYGINKGNKYHITLEELPCTIGKMAGSVDIVIKDNTISRIHAKLTKQGEGIYVTDLNSTNGTFKNGVRLDPHESVLIEEGDEIRFGRMSFCYR